MDDSEKLNNDILKNIQITSQEHMLIKSLEKFYQNENNINRILPIVNGESTISMRLIDYFVTNYSKKLRVNYNLNENGNNILFNVYTSYKSQLKAYNKKYFDPFSRGDRIPFFYKNDCLITTIGQLNFFRWFVSKNILDYVEENYLEIERDLNKSKNIVKKTKPIQKVKRVNRRPLKYNHINYSVKNATKKRENIKIVVHFE